LFLGQPEFLLGFLAEQQRAEQSSASANKSSASPIEPPSSLKRISAEVSAAGASLAPLRRLRIGGETADTDEQSCQARELQINRCMVIHCRACSMLVELFDERTDSQESIHYSIAKAGFEVMPDEKTAKMLKRVGSGRSCS
jgi:hypothetical protein